MLSIWNVAIAGGSLSHCVTILALISILSIVEHLTPWTALLWQLLVRCGFAKALLNAFPWALWAPPPPKQSEAERFFLSEKRKMTLKTASILSRTELIRGSSRILTQNFPLQVFGLVTVLFKFSIADYYLWAKSDRSLNLAQVFLLSLTLVSCFSQRFALGLFHEQGKRKSPSSFPARLVFFCFVVFSP